MAGILASRSLNRQRRGIQGTNFGADCVARLPLLGNFSDSAIFLHNFNLINYYPRSETKERPKGISADRNPSWRRLAGPAGAFRDDDNRGHPQYET